MKERYTEKERDEALRTSLTGLARALGYTPVRKGSYYSLREMDSVIIKNDAIWCRWSRIHAGSKTGRGGTQIDFMLQFGNCDTIPEAIHRILDLNNIYVLDEVKKYEKPVSTHEMILPEKADRYQHLYAYLCKTRKISAAVVSYFVHDLKILYESTEHHSMVFLGKDKDGVVRYAMKRGTQDIYGRVFKGDVKGNDKSYGVNIVNQTSPVLKVFEGSIDCMSYIDITGDVDSNKLVLGMLSDHPLCTFLKEYQHIKEIWFCLDNDERARKAVVGTDVKEVVNGCEKLTHQPGLLEIYRDLGYIVKDCPAECGKGKDYNENLQYYRQYEPDKIKGYFRTQCPKVE